MRGPVLSSRSPRRPSALSICKHREEVPLHIPRFHLQPAELAVLGGVGGGLRIAKPPMHCHRVGMWSDDLYFLDDTGASGGTMTRWHESVHSLASCPAA